MCHRLSNYYYYHLLDPNLENMGLGCWVAIHTLLVQIQQILVYFRILQIEWRCNKGKYWMSGMMNKCTLDDLA